MFAGFNLTDLDDDFISLYSNKGNNIFNESKKHIEKELDSFILSDGSIDGTRLQEDWFPQLETDIFLSHSHGDKNKAIALAGWLNDTFGLRVFIDSCVWGYADNLLKKIDDIYCKNTHSNTYSYEKRNFSTSHVHMMLSGALTKMMDKTECLIFLNTPESIETNEVINQTKSPWIFHEIATTHVLRKKEPNRFTLIKKGYYFENAQVLTVKHKLDLDHLFEIDKNDLLEWQKAFNIKEDSHALDILYEKHKLIDIHVSV
ncbi:MULTISPECIES: hypothetical protein [Bacillus]|uniref:TIR domain-containing protein n=1 Tax=Bacillus cereus VD021 TaxID=1053224 RepID=R8H0F6_BACCE|nr:hypothetical protein [Bacillus cereus]EOO66314.1 hypothetical protein IIC_05773 [Bacillus cereus VD021]